MALFQEQDSGGCRITIRPNCALSWRATKYLVLFFACCFGAVAAYFASLGAWLVLPFAGLELVVLGAGFYLSALAGHTREVLEIRAADLRVYRGRRQLVEVASFPRHWTQVHLLRDPRGWYPSRLMLRCHGRRLEIAAQIVEAEREDLAAELQDWLGFADFRDGASESGAPRSDVAPETDELPAGPSHRVFFDDGAPAGAGARVHPGDGAPRPAGREF
jgi:uncharacterized membrane protein